MTSKFSLIFYTFKKTFSYSGRANRDEFIFYISFFMLYGNIVLVLNKYYSDHLGVLLLANVILLLAPAICSLITRRLHDLNASGWWQLIFLIPFGLILFFALPFKKGTEGANRYGEQPKN
tara:strand:+ start:324 stop:683 length:360 start_codon:yes stop_codon:yes gene_type:complete